MKTLFTFLFSFIIATYSLNAQAVFSSIASGNLNATATWSIISGTDSNGDNKPDLNDDIIINAGHTVKLSATAQVKNLDIQLGGTLNGNGKNFYCFGTSFNKAGSTIGGLNFYAAGNLTLSTPGTVYNSAGKFYILGSYTVTIPSGSSIIKSGEIDFYQTNARVINNGTVSLLNQGGTIFGRLKFTGANNVWENGPNATLSMASSVGALPSGSVLDATAIGNTVNYNTSSTNVIPTTYYNLNVNSSGTKTLSGNVAVLNDMTMIASATNTLLLNGMQLSLGGNLTLNGTISGTATAGSNVVFNGTSAATQSVTGTRSISTYSMEINTPGGGVFFNTTNQNRIVHCLTMIDGNLDPNSKLTLVSDASTTARLAPIVGGAITGNLVMEKHFDQMAARWFDLSSPSSNSTVSDWDNELYISGIGIYDNIAGPPGVDGSAVFPGPGGGTITNSMFTYNESIANFDVVTGSGTALTPGIGYEMWLEGDVNDLFTETVINTTGIPNQGDVPLTIGNSALTGTNAAFSGYQLIGNPYASTIDLNEIYDFIGTYYSNMDEFDIEILNPATTGNFDVYTIFDVPLIKPHQGFWVKANAGGGTFTFHEGCKVSDNTSGINRKATNYDIKLVFTSPSTSFYHENTINFNEKATIGFEKQLDAPFRFSPIKQAPAIFMLDETGKKMSKNTINSEFDEVTISLGIYTPKTAVYYLDASVLNMDTYKYAWIEHIKTGKQFDLNSGALAIEGNEATVNNEYVLRLSKTKKSMAISQTLLESDLVIFNTDGAVNLKSSTAAHVLQEVTVYDLTGKLLVSQSNVNVDINEITKIDISHLANGVYIVHVIDELGNSNSKKIIK